MDADLAVTPPSTLIADKWTNKVCTNEATDQALAVLNDLEAELEKLKDKLSVD